MLQLGEVLHKTLGEIGSMPSSELTTWRAYFNIKAEKEEEERRDKQNPNRPKKREISSSTNVDNFKNMLGIK